MQATLPLAVRFVRLGTLAAEQASPAGRVVHPAAGDVPVPDCMPGAFQRESPARLRDPQLVRHPLAPFVTGEVVESEGDALGNLAQEPHGFLVEHPGLL